VNQCVLIEAAWQARWGNEQEQELKVQRISRLEDLLANQTKRLRLELSLQQVTPALVDDLTELLMNFKGDKPVDITIIDAEIKTPLSLHAQGILVRPDKALATELSRLRVRFAFN
jgi:regulatory protein YycI of two-component signal transduction system YycFG